MTEFSFLGELSGILHKWIEVLFTEDTINNV